MNISVIIPTYNRKDLLKRALSSVLKQTYSPFEIIVIDDGSQDGTAGMVQNQFPSVRYIFQTNSGISNTRNHGILVSRSEWIAFLDSDDEWLPGKLEHQVKALEKSPSYRICHTNEIWIRNGRRVNQGKRHEKSGGFIFNSCLPLCVISPSSVLIHRSVFEQFGTFDLRLPACEDYDLWLRICASIPVLYINELLIKKYGGHADQLSQKYWGMDRFRIYALERIINKPELCTDYRRSAIEILIRKLSIFRQGVIKRGKSDLQKIIENKIMAYKSIDPFLRSEENISQKFDLLNDGKF